MKFSLIICTYMRPESLLRLLQSVQKQTLYPDEILIIDGSLNNETEVVLKNNFFPNLHYFLVSDDDRGLTRQRNFGIAKVAETSDVVCFLDDDTVLESNYFEEIIKSFESSESIVGVGGVAINENKWMFNESNKASNSKKYYHFEKYVFKEGQRNVIRNYLGLASKLGPGMMPHYSHGRTCGFPITGKIYKVDLLIGMSMAFRKSIFEKIQFSKYFEGYGLYEDADFSLRTLAYGDNVINTNAKLFHYHEASGRPNQYEYGKMVVRNGWYVWRVKNPNPAIIDRFKWHAITVLLMVIRFLNTFTTSNKQEALTESLGRFVGWWSLMFNKPKVNS